jgi:hypothetical protein
MAASMLQWKSWVVVTETTWPTNFKDSVSAEKTSLKTCTEQSKEISKI